MRGYVDQDVQKPAQHLKDDAARQNRGKAEGHQEHKQAVPGRIERQADVDWWPVQAATGVEATRQP